MYSVATDPRGWLYTLVGVALLWTSITTSPRLGVVANFVAALLILWTALTFLANGVVGGGLGHGFGALFLLLDTSPRIRGRLAPVNLLGLCLSVIPLCVGVHALFNPAVIPSIPRIGLSGQAVALTFSVAGAFAVHANLRGLERPRIWAHALLGVVLLLFHGALGFWVSSSMFLEGGATLFRSVATMALPFWEKRNAGLSLFTLRLRVGAALGTASFLGCLVGAYCLLLALHVSRNDDELRPVRILAQWIVLSSALLAALIGAWMATGLRASLERIIRPNPQDDVAKFGIDELDAVASFVRDTSRLRRLHELASRSIRIEDRASLLQEILTSAVAIGEADGGEIRLRGSRGDLTREASVGIAGNAPLSAAAPRITPLDTRSGANLGEIALYYTTPREFSDQDVRFAGLLARQAADLLEKADADAELRESNRALARANRDLSHFAFAASHDLQEPLRMVSAYSELLIASLPEPVSKHMAECVRVITEGNQRMSALLKDLLAYTQISMGGGKDVEMEEFSLDGALREALANCQLALRDVNAIVHAAELPAVHGVRSYFVRLFQNLIANAVKYRSADPLEIRIDSRVEDGSCRVSLQDNGIGVAPEYHERIFGVFTRLHGQEIPGTGMGLAICQRIVERHSGKIWVESQGGSGARFCFEIPVRFRTG